MKQFDENFTPGIYVWIDDHGCERYFIIFRVYIANGVIRGTGYKFTTRYWDDRWDFVRLKKIL